jgi:hypothetical protein
MRCPGHTIQFLYYGYSKYIESLYLDVSITHLCFPSIVTQDEGGEVHN